MYMRSRVIDTDLRLLTHQRRRDGRLLGLGHHVPNHRLHCRLSRRDRVEVPGLRWCLLLDIHAVQAQMGTHHLLDRRLAQRHRQHHRHAHCELWVGRVIAGRLSGMLIGQNHPVDLGVGEQ